MRTAGPVLVLLMAGFGWYLIARGSMAVSIYVLAFGVLVIMTAIAVFTGDVRAPLVIVYPLLILISGWLMNARVAFLLTTVTVLATVGIFLAESWGFLPPPLASPIVIYFGDQILICLLSAALLVFVLRAYQNRLHELRRVSSDPQRRTFALEESKAELLRAQAVAKVGSWVYDITQGTMSLSSETCRIFGLAEGASVSHSAYLSRVHPADRNELEHAWQRALQGDAFDHAHRILVRKTVR